jgi:hypothetical protein
MIKCVSSGGTLEGHDAYERRMQAICQFFDLPLSLSWSPDVSTTTTVYRIFMSDDHIIPISMTCSLFLVMIEISRLGESG